MADRRTIPGLVPSALSPGRHRLLQGGAPRPCPCPCPDQAAHRCPLPMTAWQMEHDAWQTGGRSQGLCHLPFLICHAGPGPDRRRPGLVRSANVASRPALPGVALHISGRASLCHATPSFARNCDTKFRAVVPRGTVQPGRLTSGTGSPIQCHALQNSLCGWPLIAWPGWGQRPLTSLSNLAFP